MPEWGGNVEGKSIERVDVDLPSINSTNWETSKSIYKATPGNINSVTQKDFDLMLADIQVDPKFPLLNDNVKFFGLVKNVGKNLIGFNIELYEDINLDSIPDLFVESINNLSLLPSDSSLIEFSYQILNLQTKKGFYVKIISNQGFLLRQLL